MVDNNDYIDFVDEDDSMSAWEEEISKALLIELINKKQAEIFENIVFCGKKRYYLEDLSQRDYKLENTTPYQIEILGNFIEEHSWGNLLCKVSALLLELFPDYVHTVVDFRCPWSKMVIFSKENKTNFKSISNGLFLNCNHTALHSCWLLQDILDYFKVDKSTVRLLIHRPCGAEPKHVKEYIEKRFKQGFLDFLCINYGKTTEQAQKVIDNIDKYLNPMLSKISKSYNNLFLFDDKNIMYNYVKQLREVIEQRTNIENKVKHILNKYLDYLVEYYKA